jgi:hypothetical protein
MHGHCRNSQRKNKYLFAFFGYLYYDVGMFRLPRFFRKKRPVYHHIIAASLIIAYWWSLWYILDAVFLSHGMTLREIISIVIVAVVSLVAMFLFDIDFSDL